MRTAPRSVLRLAALLSVPLAACQAGSAGLRETAPAAPRQLSAFSIVVSPSADAIAATCEEACAWTRVSARNPGDVYRITRIGIGPASGAETPSAEEAARPGFSVVVSTADHGIAAACEQGCAWKRLTSSGPGVAYRITERGVEPAVAARSRAVSRRGP